MSISVCVYIYIYVFFWEGDGGLGLPVAEAVTWKPQKGEPGSFGDPPPGLRGRWQNPGARG